MIHVADEDALLILVHSCDFTEDHRGVLLVSQNPANRRANLTGGQLRRRHLIKERLKEVVIRTVDQDNLCGRLPQSLGCREASKTSSNDHDTWDTWDTLTHDSP